MNSWEKQRARQVAQAVAEREQGRRRLNSTTVAVSVASVLAAGAVAVVLPGTSHAAVTGTGATSKGSSSSGSSGSASSGSTGSTGSSGSSDNSGSSSSSDQGGIQAPSYTPQYSAGGGSVTSGGS